jgi:hypothetical protein
MRSGVVTGSRPGWSSSATRSSTYARLTVTAPSWRLLDIPEAHIDFVVDHSPGLVTVGGDRGRPFLGLVDNGGLVEELAIPSAVAELGSPRSVRWGEGGLIGVCGPTGLWQLWNQDGTWESTIPELPTDEEGNDAEWLWVTSGDGELRVVALYPTDRGPELRVWDDQLRLLARDNALYIHGDIHQVHVAAFAGRVVVCGPLGEVPPPAVAMWWSRNYQDSWFDSELDNPRWEQTPFENVPDLITHGLDWDAAVFFAGVVGGAAAIWDADGELRHVVEVAIDPTAPLVILAEAPPGDEGACIALQAASGGLLSHAGEEYLMPTGKLTAAVLNRGFDRPRCFAVIDGGLHVLELSYD